MAAVIWLEGINDFGAADTPAEAVIAGYTQGVAHIAPEDAGREDLRRHADLGAAQHDATHGRPEVEAKRKALNEFLRTSKDLRRLHRFRRGDARSARPARCKAMFQPNSSIGGPGDKLHPNRAGYAAMGKRDRSEDDRG